MYIHKLLKSFRPIASKPPTPNIYTKKKKILGFCQWSKDFNFFLMHRSNVSISIDLPSIDQRNVYTIVVRLFLVFVFVYFVLSLLSLFFSLFPSLLLFLSSSLPISLTHTHTHKNNKNLSHGNFAYKGLNQLFSGNETPNQTPL